jgi:phosphatidylserine decarboxylase
MLDVHVTRAPCDATVVQQRYRRGSHRPAFSRSAHLNERMEWTLATEHGELQLLQYAGTVARRIVAYKAVGDRLRRGERIGLIRFGSRVDLVLPVGLRVVANVGQRMYGGATVVAEPEHR